MTPEEYNKILKILNARESWLFTVKKESLKYYLLKMCGLEELFSDTIGGWCSRSWKEKMPDIEIYIDNIAKTVAKWTKYPGRYHGEEAFLRLFLRTLEFTVIHECCHLETGIHDEMEINYTVEEIIKFLSDDMNMGWSLVACPKTDGYVDFATCLACTDNDKHPECPIYAYRQDAMDGSRQYTPGRYHVSELFKGRYAYFERTHVTTKHWSEYHAMFLGKAIGWFLESKYPEGYSEYEFEVPLPKVVELLGVEPDSIDEEITILGHADIVDFDTGILYELKTIENTKYVVGAPKPEHEIQARCYMTLGLAEDPERFSKFVDNRIVYISRARARKGMPYYVEHRLGLGTYDFVEQARNLHRAVVNGKAPEVDCPSWLCRYCDHGGLCREAE